MHGKYIIIALPSGVLLLCHPVCVCVCLMFVGCVPIFAISKWSRQRRRWWSIKRFVTHYKCQGCVEARDSSRQQLTVCWEGDDAWWLTFDQAATMANDWGRRVLFDEHTQCIYKMTYMRYKCAMCNVHVMHILIYIDSHFVPVFISFFYFFFILLFNIQSRWFDMSCFVKCMYTRMYDSSSHTPHNYHVHVPSVLMPVSNEIKRAIVRRIMFIIIVSLSLSVSLFYSLASSDFHRLVIVHYNFVSEFPFCPSSRALRSKYAYTKSEQKREQRA